MRAGSHPPRCLPLGPTLQALPPPASATLGSRLGTFGALKIQTMAPGGTSLTPELTPSRLPISQPRTQAATP